MTELKFRKGFGPPVAVQMIVGLSTTLAAIGIALSSGMMVGTAGGEQSDIDQIESLVEKINNACDDAQTANPAVASTRHQLQLRSYETLFYNPSEGQLIAEKTDDTLPYQMDGCAYQLHGFPVEKDDGTSWRFDISIVDASATPPVVKVNATS